MGSGAKIALVALLILALIAIAKFVGSGKDDKSNLATNQAAPTAGSPKKDGARLVPPGTSGSTAPATRPVISNRPAGSGSPGNLAAGAGGGPAVGGSTSTGNPSTPGSSTSGPSSTGNLAHSQPVGPSVPIASAAGSNQPIQQPPGPIGAGLTSTGVSSGAGNASGPTSSAGALPRPIGNGITSSPPAPAATGASGSKAGESGAVASTGGAPPYRNLPTGSVEAGRTPAAAPAATTGRFIPASISGTGSGAAPSDGSSANPTRSPSREFPVTHKLAAGDSYWQLAEDYYGAGKGTKLYPHIAAANKNAKLIAGKTVLIPAPPAETAAQAPSAVSPGTLGGAPAAPRPAGGFVSSDERFNYYVVQRGDTLSGLAQRFLGSSEKMASLQAANGRLKYETLREGMKIRVPK